MQPEPTEVSQTGTSESSIPNTTPSTQHGIDRHHDGTRRLRSADRRGDLADPPPPAAGGERDAQEEESSEIEGGDRRLSTSSRRTGSPVDRIIEHEAASSSPRAARSAPEFRVVTKSKKAKPTNPQVGARLSDFPNEVLTHILSHLPANTLSACALVSHRFQDLVTTPYAWRIAFSRYFPGAVALLPTESLSPPVQEEAVALISDKRDFTRLTALASWRSEYILRTRLLRSLARGKPEEADAETGSSKGHIGSNGNAQVTYNSNLNTTVNLIEGTFSSHSGKRLPRFVHAADDMGGENNRDPKVGKVDSWGSLDGTSSASQFADLHPGEALYGLGRGDVVGVPNAMDVSQPHGMVQACGFPGGIVRFRSTEMQYSMILDFWPVQSMAAPETGIPRINRSQETPCCVWIAKTGNVPALTGGAIGVLLGTSLGFVHAFSLGTSGLKGERFERGVITASWVLSPGVPVVALRVDEQHSWKRRVGGRVWAVALNALGEVFYLKDPLPFTKPCSSRFVEDQNAYAWKTGRSVYWHLAEVTRRTAVVNPFGDSEIDGSYSPRSSWDGMKLSAGQIAAETVEIEKFMRYKPSHFQKHCEGWDMRRRVEVDFAGEVKTGAGEAVVIFECGLEEGTVSSIVRFTRTFGQSGSTMRRASRSSSPATQVKATGSLFGGLDQTPPNWSFHESLEDGKTPATPRSRGRGTSELVEEWRKSELGFGASKSPAITTTTMDKSITASTAAFEDALLNMSAAASSDSSPLGSPLNPSNQPGSSSDIPGRRARFVAAGTRTGVVYLWDVRAPTSADPTLTATILPLRVIHTDSPQISCLGLTALYLVHGGNDGLVQAWDPLASSMSPIRTLNSRFSSRARRRLVQAEASTNGVGINLFAAGAICLDHDPTRLRGMVSLGTHLRYWNYSSNAADQYKSSKRRLRRGERGSNNGNGDKFSHTGRGALMDYIANEKVELEKEKASKRKEQERLSGRYGVNLLGPGATDDEIMAYATMLSEEALEMDEKRRNSASEDGGSDTVTEAANSPLPSASEPEDSDIAEAIRLSLQDTGAKTPPLASHAPSAEIPDMVDTYLPPSAPSTSYSIRYSKPKARRSPTSSPTSGASPWGKFFASTGRTEARRSNPSELSDLEFAMQLSAAKEKSRLEVERDDEDFPALGNAMSRRKGSSSSEDSASGKGKGKGRRQ